MHAEILTYSRSQGVFAGVSLQGATLRPDDDANAELYRTKLSNQQIVMGKPRSSSGSRTGGGIESIFPEKTISSERTKIISPASFGRIQERYGIAKAEAEKQANKGLAL